MMSKAREELRKIMTQKFEFINNEMIAVITVIHDFDT